MLYKNFLKRFIDFTVALSVFIMITPVFVLVVIGLTFANRGKPFFLQDRPGKNNVVFRVIKFRTMNDLRDKNGQLLPDEQRLTALGKYVRKTSLDEIPQLLNVIKGNMSLIGPRPLLIEYLPLYNENQKRRHEVRPGITGLAQINGRNNLPWKERFELDVWYVDNYTFRLDMKILCRTIIKVFKSEGVSQQGYSTVQYFNGNGDNV